MKSFFSIILVLMPLLSISQSKISNQLYKQGVELLDAEKYNEALPYFQKSDSIDKAIIKPKAKNYYRAKLKIAECYEGIAWNYGDDGFYPLALEYQNIATGIYKKVLGTEHEDYATSLINLATYYEYTSDYAEAIRLQTIAKDIIQNKSGENCEYYIVSLNNLACINNDMGNLAEAVRLGKIVLDKCKNLYGEAHPYYAMSLSNQANYNDRLGNYDEAVRLETTALELKKKHLGENHPEYAASLHNLSWFYYKQANYNEAIRLETLAVEKRKQILGEEHSKYAQSLTGLAIYKSCIGNLTEALELGNRALDISKKALGDNNVQYNSCLYYLADIYHLSGDYNKAAYYYEQSYNRIHTFVLKNFAFMTGRERSNFWKSMHFIREKLPYAAYINHNSALTALAYDGQLFSKGLLLNAELEIQKLAEQSGDTAFTNLYNRIKNNRTTLDGLYQTSLEKREMDADSLAQVIDRDEHRLIESSKKFGDYTKKLSVSWRDVQNHLNDNDLAIEFEKIIDTAAQKIVYVAFVLKKDMPAPEFVRLFESQQAKRIPFKEYYSTPKFYNLVWQPLASYLKDVKTVYFAPAGQLHTIGIEYLTDEDGNIFAEKYDTYRLSSTREIALEHPINTSRKATTYGGIKYDFSEEEWEDSKNVNDSIKRSFRDIPQLGDNLRGGSMMYLEGTKVETESIANVLRNADYDVKEMSAVVATEESFKMLSGTDIKILHVGTHGFYEKAGEMEYAGYKFYTAAAQQSDEERSLSCSGLLFAGANSALDFRRINEIPEGADDGVLTAKEISRLDFQGLDLVVLSACQTGLGEITGEGVFGLQRGFKKAGAQTIVMSLWSVADESTQLLMVEFFKNLTAGQTKRAAFVAAQKVVRQKFSNPLYWAAFVMIDGI